MNDDAIESICAALLISFNDDPEHQSAILDRFAEIFSLSDKLPVIINKCRKYQTYTLSIRPLSVIPSIPGTSSSGTIGNHMWSFYTIEKDECREHPIRATGVTRLDMGSSRHINLRITQSSPKNDSKRGGLSRTGSLLLKKVMRSESCRKTSDILPIGQLPLNTFVKKCLSCGGSNFSAEFKLMRNDNRHLIRCISFNDFLEMSRRCHEWQASQMSKDSDGYMVYDGKLDNLVFSMFYSIAFFFEIPSFILKITEITNFMVWDDEENGKITDDLMNEINIQMNACEPDVDLKHPHMIQSLRHLNDCTKELITRFIDSISSEQLFPPISHLRLKPINDSLKLIADICVMRIWDDFPTLDCPSDFLASQLQNLLISSAEKWVDQVCVMNYKDMCTAISRLITQMYSESQSYQIFFNQFVIDYSSTCIETIDQKLSECVQTNLSKELQSIDSRNANVLERFSKTSMRLFMNLRDITTFDVDLISLNLKEFEKWFSNVSLFWSYSWRQLTSKMVERTISLDEDGDSVKYGSRRPLPAGLYSFLCIQKGISDDLHRLEFNEPANLVTSSVSVINILCQNINSYTKKLISEAMRYHDEQESRLVRAMNGIEQAMCFVEEGHRRYAQFHRLEQMAEKLDYDAVRKTSARLLNLTRNMTPRKETPIVTRQAVINMRENGIRGTEIAMACDKKILSLLKIYIKIRCEELSKITRNLCEDLRDSSNSLNPYRREVSTGEKIESILESFYIFIDDIRCLLLPHCFQMIKSPLIKKLEKMLCSYLLDQQQTEYYSNIYLVLKCIYDMIEMDEDKKNIRLLTFLHVNSFSTKDLILSYYDALCDKIKRSINENGLSSSPSIDVHVNHLIVDDSEQVLIQIKFVKMSQIETIDLLSQRCDYFIRLELYPKCVFPSNRFISSTTSPIAQSTKPQWKQFVQIRVPIEEFFTRGTCLCVSVFDHDRSFDRLIGRGYIGLHTIPKFDSTKEEFDEACRVPLLPNEPFDESNVHYQVLKRRSAHDLVAREFIDVRHRRLFRISDISRYIRRHKSRLVQK